MTTATTTRRDVPRAAPRRPDRAVARWAALAWSVAVALAGAWWTLGGAGFPFGSDHDPQASMSALGGVEQASAAPVIALLGLLGAGVAVVMARDMGSGPGRRLLLAFAWTAAAGLTLVVPDARLLMLVGYAPALLLGAPFGWPPGVDVLAQLAWPLPAQALVVLGGVAWAAAALRYARATGRACPACGRGQTGHGGDDPTVLRHRGRWAVAVATVVPVGYAATRFAWALGVPLGIDPQLLAADRDSWMAGAALATFAVVGAVLQLGLVQRWGEVVPRWVPVLGGRRVPVRAAVVPATAVAVLLAAGGMMFLRLLVTQGRAAPTDGLGAVLPVLLLPVWAAGLGWATLLYSRRRRRPCAACGRGQRTAEPQPSGTNPDS